jgi:hypothetical protein
MHGFTRMGSLLFVAFTLATAGCLSPVEEELSENVEAVENEVSPEGEKQAASICPYAPGSYTCATWGKVGADAPTNYVLTYIWGGYFSYAGINQACCQGQDMTRQPGFLCPRQPDGSCAYNVGDGYGSISYRYPEQCGACDP